MYPLFYFNISIKIIVLKLKATHTVFQVQVFKGVELFTTSMDNSSAVYRSFKQMFFDLAVITTSFSAKGGK